MNPPEKNPIVVVLAGPNGAGKSTAAPRLLKGALKVTEFLNADLIARGISPFNLESAAVAIEAGKVLLCRMDSLAKQRISFGLESTLAGRTLVPRLNELNKSGYKVHLVYVYLRSPDLAVTRVADRVRHGGHNIPEETIRRRYDLGLRNFVELYRPLATTWRIYDNSKTGDLKLIALGSHRKERRIPQPLLWKQILRDIQS